MSNLLIDVNIAMLYRGDLKNVLDNNVASGTIRLGTVCIRNGIISRSVRNGRSNVLT